MNQAKDLQPVLDGNLCIACGACVAAEPSLRLELNPKKRMYEPSGPGGPEAAMVCPALRVDFPNLQARLFPGAKPTAVGIVDRIVLAQSTDEVRNLRSSSGGLIKELLHDLLSREDVDGAIALQHVEGLSFEPTLITESSEVDSLPGSIYHNVSFEKALKILESREGRFVLVAIPCQLEGIYTYIFRKRPELVQRIYTTIGLICGWTYTHHSLEAICEFKGVRLDTIQNISFRGGGPRGPLVLELPDEAVVINRRTDFDYFVAFDRSFNVPRCHLCINHINVLAEIVVGDAWLARTEESTTGVSIVICRTPRARELMQRLEEHGRIRQVTAGESEIAEAQGRLFTYGDFSYAYAEFLRQRGKFAPNMTGPNRPAAQLISAREISRFHRENWRKIRLQQSGRYRYLWWRKILRDAPRYFLRFTRRRLTRLFRKKSMNLKLPEGFN